MQSVILERLDAGSPHLRTVAGWTFAAWGHQHPEHDSESWCNAVAAYCGAAGVPSVFVAMRDGEPLGTASLSPDDMSIRRELSPWLASVFVPEASRGRGLASKLVQRVEAEARDHGITRLYLYTPDQQALYARLGWRAYEDVDYLGERVTIMVRELGGE